MRVWESEYISTNICNLNDDDLNYFMNFQKQMHDWKNAGVDENLDPITQDVFLDIQKESVNSINFFIKDLLDLRQEKIINTCKELKVIDQHLLTSSEKEFYKTITSAFKGYSKIRNAYDVITDSCEPKNEEEVTNETFCQAEEIKVSPHDIQYRTIRIIKTVPAIVGSDFLVYGPFKKGDVANLPKPNAIILEKENLAQSLDS